MYVIGKRYGDQELIFLERGTVAFDLKATRQNALILKGYLKDLGMTGVSVDVYKLELVNQSEDIKS